MTATPSVKDQVSQAEWALRCDLAACYRLVALYGWSDLVFTHISVRLPDSVSGDEPQFLINPYGMMFDEITASSLVKVDILQQAAGLALPGQPRRFYHPQRHSPGAARRPVRVAHPHARRGGRKRTQVGRFAH
jgi:hypothetical protein